MYAGRLEFADLFEHCRMDSESESKEFFQEFKCSLNALKAFWYIPTCISLLTLDRNE